MTHGTGLARVEPATSLLPSFKVTSAYECVLTHVCRSLRTSSRSWSTALPVGVLGIELSCRAWLKGTGPPHRVPKVVAVIPLFRLPQLAPAGFSPLTSSVQFSGCKEMNTQDSEGPVSTQGQKVVVGDIPQATSPGLLGSWQAPGLTAPLSPFRARL